ncbi:fibroblast growth factor 1-like isoform X2 [Actinia tenebrosa]|uniref:Fibroblast growth factor 1-like isoform X2 n=1 Tax=Actinia tenebrosa TaxID=6105 RepID=A0A6P8HK30_ACTTE|nr:fibroblast growth factor 1-like isoform X2 [Actinia tenebrosa]
MTRIHIMVKFRTSVNIYILSSLYLLVSRWPVSEAVPIQRRKEPGISRGSKNDLMLPSESGVVISRTTPEHEVFMKVLFPTPINKNLHLEPVSFIRRGTLTSKYNYLLYIRPDGSVGGTSNDKSKYVKLEFHSVDHGHLMILGVATNRYLSITDDGHLIGQDQPSLNSVLKEEYLPNLYQSFKSYKYQKKNWYVGIKRNGKPKKAQDTDEGQKAVQFLIRYDDGT